MRKSKSSFNLRKEQKSEDSEYFISIRFHILILLFFLLSASALAMPNNINIQGKLTNPSGAIQTGTFNFTFRIYDSFTGGNLLYETNLTAATDARGVYDIIIKNVNLTFQDQLYLAVKVNADSEMEPRVNLTSVPYTFRANTSEALNPNAGYFVTNLSVSGNLTVGTTLYVESASNFVGIGTMSPKYLLQVANASKAVNLSNIFFVNGDTGNVGIGTIGPQNKLEVIGAVTVAGTLNASSINTTGSAYFATSSGSVGIGTITPLSTLHVNGTGFLVTNGSSTGVTYPAFFVNATSGNVGIGTTNPTKKVQIGSPTGSYTHPSGAVSIFALGGNPDPILDVFNTKAATDGWGAGIGLGGENGQATSPYFFGSLYGAKESGGTYNGLLSFYTANSAAALVEAIHIDSQQRVGIGTAAPGSVLSVSGNFSTTTGALLATSSGNVGIGTTSPGQKLVVVGGVNITGGLNVSGDTNVSNLYVTGNTVIGDSTSDTVEVNAQVASNIVPNTNSRNLGSPTNFWHLAYIDMLTVNNLTAGSSNISGTGFPSFTINANYTGNDAQDVTLIFERGSPVTNAVLFWDSTNKRFDINFPLFIEANQNLTVDTNTLFVDGSIHKVGIGTITPGQKLQVVGSANITSDLFVIGTIYGALGAGNITGSLKDSQVDNDITIQTTADLTVGGGYSAGGVTLIATGGDKGSGQFAKDILIDGQIVAVNDVEINRSFIPTKDLFSTLGNSSNRFLDVFAANVKSGNQTLNLNANVSISGNLTVNTNTLVVDNVNGRVGIGTTTPQNKLEVIGAVTVAGSLNASSINTTGSAYFATSSGSVGIGTTAPSEKLTVIGNTNISGYLNISGDLVVNMQFNVTASTGNVNVAGILDAASLRVLGNIVQVEKDAFKLSNYSAEYASTGFKRGNITDFFGDAGFNASVLRIGNYSNLFAPAWNFANNETYVLDNATIIRTGNLSLIFLERNSSLWNRTNGNTVLRFISDNVGIGTTTPDNLLTVLGNELTANAILHINASDNFNKSVINVLTLDHVLKNPVNSTGGVGVSILFRATDNASQLENIGNISAILYNSINGSEASAITFSTRGADTGDNSGGHLIERMRIDGSGNVGIGTTAPTEKLVVVGNINATGKVVIGTDLNGEIVGNGLNIGSTSQSVGAILGQSGTNHLRIFWNYDATPASAYGSITTYGFSNPLRIDVSSLLLNSQSGGKVGIGQTSPNVTLGVSGSANITGALTVMSGANVSNGLNVISGNVGIGTTAPQNKLEVIGAVTVAGTLNASSINTTGSAYFATNSGSVGVGLTNPNYLLQVASGTDGRSVNLSNVLYVNGSSGRVGIGTTSPSTRLGIVATEITNPEGTPILTFDTTAKVGANGGPIINFSHGGQSISFIKTSSGGGNTAPYLAFGVSSGAAAPDERMRIDQTNVIIGSTAANNKLVVSDNTLTSVANVRGGTTLEITRAAGGDATIFFNHGDQLWSTGVLSGGNYVLAASNGLAATPRLTILPGGNLGIGTTAPFSKLHINVSDNFNNSVTNILTLDHAIQNGTNSTGGIGVSILFRATDNASQLEDIANISAVLVNSTNGTEYGAITFATRGADKGDGASHLTEVMRITNGSVGIGTTSPGAKLDVAGQIIVSTAPSSFSKNGIGVNSGDEFQLNAGAGGIRFNNAANSANLAYLTNAGNFIVGSGTAQSKLDVVGGVAIGSYAGSNAAPSNGLIVSGNVGIGTTAPFSKLHINVSDDFNTSVTNILTLDHTNPNGVNLTGGIGVSILFRATDNASQLYKIGNISAILYNSTNGSQKGAITFSTSGSDTGDNSFGHSIERMRIDGSGNVGIGTTSPDARLKVSGDINATGTVWAFGLNLSTLTASAGGWTDDGTVVRLTTSSDLVGIGKTNPATQLDVAGGINASTLNISGNAYLATSSGNVGIGTTAPQNKLEVIGAVTVAGTLNASSINTTGNAYFATSSGNVGIGTTSPGQKLVVAGNANISQNLTVNNSVLFVDGTSGNVGIGTTSPGARLEVAGVSTPQAIISNTGDGTSQLSLARSGGVSWGIYRYGSAVSDRFNIGVIGVNEPFTILTGGNVGINQTSPTQTLHVVGTLNVVSGSGTQGLFQNSAGNVGIGKTNPASLLDVAGTINASTLTLGSRTSTTGTIRLGNTSGIYFRSNADTFDIPGLIYADSNTITIGDLSDNFGGINIYATTINLSTTSGALRLKSGGSVSIDINKGGAAPGGNAFQIRAQNGYSTKLFLNDDGMLGINVTPTDTLHVVGTARINGGSSGTGLFVDKNSNVGIGTTSPGQKLVVVGNANISQNLTVNNSVLFVNGNDGFVGIGFTTPAARLQVRSPGVGNTVFGTQYSDGSNLFYVSDQSGQGQAILANPIGTTKVLLIANAATSSANSYILDTNLGIGTFTPDNLLTVLGNELTANAILHLNASDNFNKSVINLITLDHVLKSPVNSTGGVGVSILFRATDNASQLYNIGNISAILYNSTNGSQKGAITFSTSGADTGDGSFGHTVERMRIDGTGKVGINNTAPNETLAVRGTLSVISGSGTQGLFQDTSGNVGIGTTSPASLLQVAGNSTINNTVMVSADKVTILLT